MNKKVKRTTSQWIEVLAKKELPAITSVAGMLDKFSNDDTSSIPQLSRAILHDQSLSSCVLKVANNSHHVSRRKVTTVSRASIVLGIQAVKNICLTSKILDGLLQSKNLGPEVHQRLTLLMANAFYAGLLAKMMVPDYSDDTKEEVYLAAMLYHIGETSFWSTGCNMTEQLIKDVELPSEQFKKQCTLICGLDFTELSIGLAKTWKLGELLIKSLDQPDARTVEMQTISLANQLSAAISTPPEDKAEFDEILKRVANVMNVKVHDLKVKIEDTRDLAIQLLSSYGASILENHIKPLPKEQEFNKRPSHSSAENFSQEKSLLTAISKLTKMAKAGHNINDFLSFALQNIAHILEFERCSFWMLSSDKRNIESRTSYNDHGHAESFHCNISLTDSSNMLSHVVNMDRTVLINDFREPKWGNYITVQIEKLIANGVICVAPVKIDNKVIGVVSAQIFTRSKLISDDNYEQFCFIIDHLNMCLSMISHSKG